MLDPSTLTEAETDDWTWYLEVYFKEVDTKATTAETNSSDLRLKRGEGKPLNEKTKLELWQKG